MPLSKAQKLILYSLGEFYHSLNQPLTDKSIELRTSKIAFIELLLKSNIFHKQQRAVYKNLESLEQKGLIAYDQKMVKFTEKGIKNLEKINNEVKWFIEIEHYFKTIEKPRRKLQTVIKTMAKS